MAERLVVIGAGQAAQSVIEAARGAGFDGEITLVGDEPERPYQRPPLSKAYLSGEMARERLPFRPAAYFAEQRVALRLAQRATAIDRVARRVDLEGGEALGYDRLVIATGARPRRLPAAIGGDLAGVLTLRGLADADALAQALPTVRRAVVVGGGYIGLEAAASLRKRGLAVTLIEREKRILARVACAATAAYFDQRHRAEGVDLRVDAALARFEPGADGRLDAATLASGERIACELAVVGVGVTPNDELAAAAGLAVADGVLVDAQGRSSDPAIFAAGDVARFGLGGRSVRLESVQNAIDQGAVVGRAAAGAPGADYAPTPWFWSDQYDVKLQIAGLGDGAVDWITRPGPRPGAQSVWYYDAAERLLAVDAMNDGRAYLVGRKLLEHGRPAPKRVVADASADLKELL